MKSKNKIKRKNGPGPIDQYGRSILRITCDPKTFARKRTYKSNFFE